MPGAETRKSGELAPALVPQEWQRGTSELHSRWRSAWLLALQEHALFLAIIAAQFLAALIPGLWGIQILKPMPWDLPSIFGPLSDAPAWFLVLLAWHRTTVRDAAGQPVVGWQGWRRAGRDLVDERLCADRILGALIVSSGIVFQGYLHDDWKSAIGVLRPYGWDSRLYRLDLWIHGGVSPWVWLQPVLGRPLLTKALDLLYVSWYFVLAGVLLWQCWTTRRQLRAQFLICYMLSVVLLGTVAAHVFASAGPCFYGPLLGPDDPYAPLTKYLASVDARYPLIALQIQRTIWQNHLAGLHLQWAGMSAMPSLHVGMAILFALVGWAHHRLLGLALAVFAVLTLIGAVHLAWHYAVDGYVAALVVIVLWPLSGRLAAWQRDLSF